MSLGIKYNPNNWLELIWALAIGIAIFIFGMWALIDRFFFSSLNGLVDLGKYHIIIGVCAIALSCIYLFLVIKNYTRETS